MHGMLMVESAARGLLYVNGQFAGPLEREGQAFPVGGNGEVYLQLFSFGEGAPSLTAQMRLRDGGIEELEPKENCFALIWPDRMIQLELRMRESDRAQADETQQIQPDVLMRYLKMRLAGDSRAALLRAGQRDMDAPDVSAYYAAVPVRFLPADVPDDWYDQRAGLVRRLAENIARVDIALARTSLDGQGRRVIDRVDIAQGIA